MKKTVKSTLASLSVSTLIAGGSLPLMAADKPADKPEAAQVKENKAGPRCAGMKPEAAQIKENKAGKKCAGGSKSAPVEKMDEKK